MEPTRMPRGGGAANSGGIRRFRRSVWGEAVETVALAVVLSYLLRLMAFQAFFIPSRSMLETLAPFDHVLAEKITRHFRSPARGEIVIFDFADSPPVEEFLLGSTPVHGADAPATAEPREYVKRVVGVEGDEIAFRGGALYVNGERVAEPYLRGARIGAAAQDAPFAGGFALVVPGRRLAIAGGEVQVDGRPLAEALPPGVPASAVEDLRPTNFVRLDNGAIGILKVRVPAGTVYLLGDNRIESADSRFFGFVPVERIRGRALVTYWPLSRLRHL